MVCYSGAGRTVLLTNVTIAADNIALNNSLEFTLYHITVITVIVAAVYAVTPPPPASASLLGGGGPLPPPPPCSYFTVL